jgi:heme exporter protein C
MKNIWWKILSIFIMIYALVFGMLVPLKPGVDHVSVNSAKAGDTLLLGITGYNTSFSQASTNRIWLKFSNTAAIEAQSKLVKSDTLMVATFHLPAYLPVATKVKSATLVIDSDTDGGFPYPDAVFITQNEIDTLKGKALWNQVPQNLHATPFMSFPYRNILTETIRNTYFHVPLWFAMMLFFMISGCYSAIYLGLQGEKTSRFTQFLIKISFKSETSPLDYIRKSDAIALAYTNIGVLYGVLGLITGMIWAKNTWGAYWSFDVKQNMAAVCVLIYAAYFVLRGSFEDEEKRARISAAYNIFALFAMFPLLFVIPRLTDSLHPGNGGNPAFGGQDLDNTMRLIFYPAIIGFMLFGGWMAQLLWRMQMVKEKLNEY